MRPEERRIRNREKIIDASWKLFEEKGVNETSIGMIAQEADIAPRTVANIFGTKNELTLEVVMRLFEDSSIYLRKLTETAEYAGMTGFRQVMAVLQNRADYLEAFPKRMMIISETKIIFSFAGEMELLYKVYRGNHDFFIYYTRLALEKGIEDGSIRSDLDIDKAIENIDLDYAALLQFFAPLSLDGSLYKRVDICSHIRISIDNIAYYLTLYPNMSSNDGKRMLIVDDNKINRDILAGAFKDDYEILTADNGRSALDILEQGKKIAVVILDLQMPVMDGFECLRNIRSRLEYRETAVIINTLKDQIDNESKALKMGADEFISKPYNIEIVKHRVNNVMYRYGKSIENRLNTEKLTKLRREISRQTDFELTRRQGE